MKIERQVISKKPEEFTLRLMVVYNQDQRPIQPIGRNLVRKA
jgi:hypothetical protein